MLADIETNTLCIMWVSLLVWAAIALAATKGGPK